MSAEHRVALVIGNGAYSNIPVLKNPANDARALARALTACDFELIGNAPLLDADHAEIEAGAILGGQAGILPHKKFRGRGEVFWGTPAKPVREYLKELATLTRLAKKKI